MGLIKHWSSSKYPFSMFKNQKSTKKVILRQVNVHKLLPRLAFLSSIVCISLNHTVSMHKDYYDNDG